MDVVAVQQAKSDAKKRYAPSSTTKLLGWHVGIAKRATTPCDVLVVADSVGEGVGTNTGTLANRWVNQALLALRQHYPTQDIAGGFGYKPAWNSVGLSAPVTSGSTAQAANGIGHRSLTLGAGATVTYSELCTSFKLYLKRSTTDALTVVVDGGAPTTVTAGPSGEFTVTSAALSRGTHSIVITQTAGTPEVEGLMLFDGDETTGIRLWDGSKSGAKAGDWTTASGGSQAWLTAATNAGFTPSLVILGLGLNDATNVSAATFKTNMTNLITAVRAQWANVAILLVGSYQPPSRQSGLIEAWGNYGGALQALADTTAGVAYLDLMNRLGSIPTDTYSILNDTTHPNVTGQRLYAQYVGDFIRSGQRDVDVLRVSEISTDGVFLDTTAGSSSAVPNVPSAPARGAILFGDSQNGVPLAKSSVGDVSNALGKRVAISSSQNPVRVSWREMDVTTAASTITLTLPASGVAGQEFEICKVDSGAGTVVIAAPAPGGNQQTIAGPGLAAANSRTLSGQWTTVTIRSTGLASTAGVGWVIKSSGGTVT